MNTYHPGHVPALHPVFTWMSDLGKKGKKKTFPSSPNVIFLQSPRLIFLSCISSAHFHFLSHHIPISWPSPIPYSSLYTLEHCASVMDTLRCNLLFSGLGWRPLKLIQRPLLIHGAPVRSSLALPLWRLVSPALSPSLAYSAPAFKMRPFITCAHHEYSMFLSCQQIPAFPCFSWIIQRSILNAGANSIHPHS